MDIYHILEYQSPQTLQDLFNYQKKHYGAKLDVPGEDGSGVNYTLPTEEPDPQVLKVMTATPEQVKNWK